MGKKTDRMYITCHEWVNDFGGKREGIQHKKGGKPLPYDCCSLALTPFQDPVCTPEGTIFDIINIIPFLKKFGLDPTTGNPLSLSDLVKLHFHKNQLGKYYCPVLYKEFTEFSHIAAIRTSGNVYSYEAIDQLNIKTKNWKDLLTGDEFTRQDIICLQDPKAENRKTLSELYHLRKGLKLKAGKKTPTSDIRTTPMSDRIFKELKEKQAKEAQLKVALTPEELEKEKEKEKSLAKQYQSASFTATGFSPKPVDEEALKEAPKHTTKKGYVRLSTSHGYLNLELHCDLAPKTCENFLLLSQSGYYNNTIFHRSIRNFMIQGGDPQGTGTGGQSCWSKPFKDEFCPKLLHSERGVVSMANSGPNTNGSQFFILFKSAKHLNQKHTVFGRVVGGMDVLRSMELVPTDDKDRPKKDITLLEAIVYTNPFEEVPEEISEAELKAKKEAEEEANAIGQWYSNPGPSPVSNKVGIGKYIQTKEPTKPEQMDNKTPATSEKKRSLSLTAPTANKIQKKSFNDSFSNW